MHWKDPPGSLCHTLEQRNSDNEDSSSHDTLNDVQSHAFIIAFLVLSCNVPVRTLASTARATIRSCSTRHTVLRGNTGNKLVLQLSQHAQVSRAYGANVVCTRFPRQLQFLTINRFQHVKHHGPVYETNLLNFLLFSFLSIASRTVAHAAAVYTSSGKQAPGRLNSKNSGGVSQQRCSMPVLGSEGIAEQQSKQNA
jgi:hypothetical protein